MTPVGVLHIPHSSVEIPPDVRRHFLVSDETLHRELLKMTDWFTDELFALPADEAVVVRFPVSRLVLDPERFIDDEREVMSRRGMGVIYTRMADGRPLREPPTPDERQALVAQFYEPHHQLLSVAVQAALAAHGRCMVIDCHSFPSRPLPCDLDQAPERPDICLGTDAYHTPDWLRQLGTSRFSAAGLSVEVDRPYSGALVPAECYGQDARVHTIMIEINRMLYMDEGTGIRTAAFAEVARIVRAVMLAMLAACGSRASA